MTHQETQMFEDQLALIHCLPQLNNLRVAGKLTDLTIELVKSDQLKNVCLQHIKATFEATGASYFFIRLPPDAVLSLLRADDLQVDSEESLFKTIERWVSPLGEVDETRVAHAASMMKEMRWYQVAANFRNQLDDEDGFWNTNVECL
ncbi:unnamed protein product [Dibothriocephalus latus]|uniref:BACK domain-containing protein n=1 Tax=Dibothriocephalus latus TaxID=60516 RepID=A0A3P7P311_DIBLA|nr:unnamed protein product [Dibothriocephalus latus]